MSLRNFIMVVNSQVVTVEPEPEPEVGALIINTYKSLSNKYVDLTFSDGVFSNPGVNPVTTDNFSIVDFVAGGVTNIAIASVKINNHYTSGSATNLIGGDLVVRVFLTLTGTPDSTESFRIRATDICDDNGILTTSNSDTIYLNITPLILWDYQDTASVTTSGLGISTFADVMGVANLTQTTEADRPLDAFEYVYFDRDNTEYFNGGDVGALDFQKANAFTIVIKKFRVLNSGTGGYVVSNRSSVAAGWSISTGTDGSLFFVMNDGTNQATADYDAFNGSAERDVMFFVNDGTNLRIYDSAGNQLGTSGSLASVGAISYTGINLQVGHRPGTSASDLEGYFQKMAIVNSALTLAQRNRYVENI